MTYNFFSLVKDDLIFYYWFIEAILILLERMMIKFIEVDIANTDAKTLVNVSQIVNIGSHYSNNNGYIAFNSSGGDCENCIQTKQSYDELKQMICN